MKYKSHKNDQFLEGVQEFGIHNLHFDKQKLLQDLLVDCDKEVWISGYRLILTSKITDSLVHAIQQGASIRMLISPPWHPGFQSVYGEKERAMDHYFKVLQAIARASDNVEKICEVRFTSKPLFNDTYKIDMHLVTGPYLHNRDEEHHRITANDFFTYDLIRKSRLYQLIESEYLTIWEEAEERLDWDRYAKAVEEYRTKDLRESEKVALIKNACTRIEAKIKYA